MGYITQLAKKSTYYLGTNSLLSIAGVISFPIWTRMFSRSEYGVLNLIEVLIAGIVPFAKFGIQNAAVRFYPDYSDAKDKREFYTTLLLGSCFVSGLLAVVGFIFVKVILSHYI